MNTRPIVIGTQVRFAREGVVSVNPAGPITAALKPDVADASWTTVGTVLEGESEYTEQVRETFIIVNGARHVNDELIYGRDLKLNFTLEDYSDLISELRFGHLALSGAGGQFNPLERVKVVKGWLKMQETDPATGSNVTVLDGWVRLKLPGALAIGEQGPKPQIEARLLYSALNTGSLLVA